MRKDLRRFTAVKMFLSVFCNIALVAWNLSRIASHKLALKAVYHLSLLLFQGFFHRALVDFAGLLHLLVERDFNVKLTPVFRKNFPHLLVEEEQKLYKDCGVPK